MRRNCVTEQSYEFSTESEQARTNVHQNVDRLDGAGAQFGPDSHQWCSVCDTDTKGDKSHLDGNFRELVRDVWMH